ncbi:LPXTG cell wall anchor domain-containing protein [Lacticaseibacillus absianus]|uniref:LPXTG cell wall anchor domain-containing protein n=1 Tax=Lacticaseibacillus absianus TaxID=2729623 RepID=UPI0015CACC0A|nr:LPXTG cell wall anchor domain-containing protein [Lacticaseibacillus absianus]
MERKFGLLVAGLIGLTVTAGALSAGHEVKAAEDVAPLEWQSSVQKAVDAFEDKGGYYTGRKIPEGFTQNTWMGMDEAVTLDPSGQATIDVAKARPSFCSSAIYMLFLKSLSNWSTDYNHPITAKSWINLKPYTMDDTAYPIQGDGVGAWGMANSNGPGYAVLLNQLGMGKNYYVGLASEYSTEVARLAAFAQGQKYDVMKIFWNDSVGKDEAGHLVLYLGREDETDPTTGKVTHYIKYWSSNGSTTDINAGYSVAKCNIDKIKRAVFTRVTAPSNINQVESIAPVDKNQFLADLSDKIDATTAQVKSFCGIDDQATVQAQAVDLNGQVLQQIQVSYPDGPVHFGAYQAVAPKLAGYRYVGVDNGKVTGKKSVPATGMLANRGVNGTISFVYAHTYTLTTSRQTGTITYLDQQKRTCHAAGRTTPVTFLRVTDQVTHRTVTYYRLGVADAPALTLAGVPAVSGWQVGTQVTLPAVAAPSVKGLTPNVTAIKLIARAGAAAPQGTISYHRTQAPAIAKKVSDNTVKTAAKTTKLPQTGETTTHMMALIGGAVLLIITGTLLNRKKADD